MKNIFNILIAVIFAHNLYAQDLTYKNRPEQDKFYYEYLDFKSNEPNKTRVDVFIQVPYDEIQFIKSGNNFIANYVVTVSIFDKDKEKLIAEKTWNEKVETQDFDLTTSHHNFNLSLRSFDLLPGEYLFRSAYEDKDSRKTYSKEDHVKVRNIDTSSSISDIMIIEKKTIENGNNKILPNISKVISSRKGGLPIFFEIYSDTSLVFQIEYDINDNHDNTIISDKTMKQLNKGVNQIFYTVPDSTLSMGDYKIQVMLTNVEDKQIATSTQSFISRWVGFPSTVKDLDEAVEQLVYIASPEDIDYIDDAKNKDERIKRYLEFWKKKDPVPSTEENEVFNEYYRRVAFADANFSHYEKGWKTDRGMVYIILGSPNNVDRHPFEYDSKPYEVWEYYQLNQSFVFVDETGFGDYRLVTPLSGDLYRYRY
jgi:GWxTD domain-containing protein